MFSEFNDSVSPNEVDILLSDCFFLGLPLFDNSVWNFIPIVGVRCGFLFIQFPVGFAFRLNELSCRHGP